MKIFGKDRAFTLIELMIVVAIIGILAAVAIPRFADMLEKAREGATKGNIGAIKSAIAIYYGDNSGVWPDSITAPYFSNYLDRIPPVKVTHPKKLGGHTLSGTATVVSVVTASGVFTDTTDGWKYNSSDGNVWVNNSQTDTMGTVYYMYGYD